MRLHTTGMAATLIVLTACGTPGVPTAGARVSLVATSTKPAPKEAAPGEPAAGTSWVYFVSWSGILNGSTVIGMQEASIDGPPKSWDSVLTMVAKIQAANPGVEQVKIVNYNLMRIE